MPNVGKSASLCKLGATLGFRRGADDTMSGVELLPPPGLFRRAGGTYGYHVASNRIRKRMFLRAGYEAG